MAALTTLAERGVVDIPEPRRTVWQLIAMMAGAAQLIRTFRRSYQFAERELETMVSSGVDAFLSDYGTTARPVPDQAGRRPVIGFARSTDYGRIGAWTMRGARQRGSGWLRPGRPEQLGKSTRSRPHWVFSGTSAPRRRS